MIVRKKLSGGLERLMLIGLITNEKFCELIVPIYKRELIKSKPIATLINWTLNYYETYNEAPSENIKLIYESNISSVPEEHAGAIEELFTQVLDEIDRRGDDLSSEFVLQQVIQYFQQRTIETNIEDIQKLLSKGRVEEAKQAILGIELPELETNKTQSHNILTDPEILREGFDSARESLIYFPNALGLFINPLLCRRNFIGILGTEKRGKTWRLNEIALQALKCRRNVAYFNVGDMDNEEQAVRFASRISRLPTKEEHCGERYIPVLDCQYNREGTCTKKERTCDIDYSIADIEITKPEDVELAPPDYTPCRVCSSANPYEFKGCVWYKKIKTEEYLTWRTALKKNKEFLQRHNLNEDKFRMRSYPNGTVGINDIDRTLEKWAIEDGFTADVILIDYMDILGIDPKLKGTRHGENENWKRARALSQKWNALVVSPTQANKPGLQVETLTESNVSEDKRKWGHSTGIITLNQTEEEKELGIMRIGRFMTRHLLSSINQQVVCLQDLTRGMTHLGSFFRHKKQSNDDDSE